MMAFELRAEWDWPGECRPTEPLNRFVGSLLYRSQTRIYCCTYVELLASVVRLDQKIPMPRKRSPAASIAAIQPPKHH